MKPVTSSLVIVDILSINLKIQNGVYSPGKSGGT